MVNRQKIFLIVAAIVLAAAVLYCYNPFKLYFQNDDFLHVQLSKQGVLFQRNSFRPVCDVSVMLDYLIWGTNAGGYHLTNLLLHIVATVLVFYVSITILKSCFDVSNKSIAVVAALLFFCYASHSEAVFWILGRSAILGAIFSMLFLLFYLKKTSVKNVAAFLLFYILVLLTYESCWVLPLFCWILFFIPNKAKKKLLQPVLITLIFLLYLLARWFVIGEVVGKYEAVNFLQTNVHVLGDNYVKLVARSLLPPLSVNSVAIGLYVLINVMLVTCVFRATIKVRKQVLVAFIFFLVSLLPYASLGIDSTGTEAERFLYLPSFIWCVIVAFIVMQTLPKRLAFFAIFFICCSFVFVLCNNAKNYRLAGSITRQFVVQVNKLKSKQRLFVENLPQSQHGALILRQGLDSANVMIQKAASLRDIIVCSRRPETKTFNVIDYKVREVKSMPTNSCSSTTFNKNSDALFVFTDSALIIVK